MGLARGPLLLGLTRRVAWQNPLESKMFAALRPPIWQIFSETDVDGTGQVHRQMYMQPAPYEFSDFLSQSL